MSNFDDFGFISEAPKKNNNQSTNFEEKIEEFTKGLENFLEPWKPMLEAEFKSLEKNNKKWKNEHDGKDCSAFMEKQWAIAAPFNAIKIFTRLYINRERKDN